MVLIILRSYWIGEEVVDLSLSLRFSTCQVSKGLSDPTSFSVPMGKAVRKLFPYPSPSL